MKTLLLILLLSCSAWAGLLKSHFGAGPVNGTEESYDQILSIPRGRSVVIKTFVQDTVSPSATGECELYAKGIVNNVQVTIKVLSSVLANSPTVETSIAGPADIAVRVPKLLTYVLTYELR